MQVPSPSIFFFFNDTATTEIYTLSLHDALPISTPWPTIWEAAPLFGTTWVTWSTDRKSTRLNSSHRTISYAVFCLKKKKKKNEISFINTKKNKKIKNLKLLVKK